MLPRELVPITVGVVVAGLVFGFIVWAATRDSDYPPGLQ